ncbi:bifunctional RNase H/acid phosphatase [Corynebacterium vitaeruminis]|uniref:Bifunctional RNase H/acid phosphatase n=1 Tax=Corynebacterium vitaeruminis DSM 20294 TaxID=1224164 RepID=W5Y2W6_9CORY|nr:bifunctional RNase H/acid phosphatase [Corynebacterium vitaeruminis]AHI23249.1 bifunctional RNase H/acid phosphatase [Corynebacterium vitaeruminis DSM 20294]
MSTYEDITIEADGGSRGNPGAAGSGTVLLDGQGAIIDTLAYVVGKATNNVAEYHALLNGLNRARELGARRVSVRMDSKLVIEQMSGRWKIKHPDMRELALKCRDVAQGFDSVTYTWVPRKENSRADELANKAMDALQKGAKVGFLESAPSVPTEPTQAASEETSKEAEKPATSWNGAVTQATRFILLRHGQTPMSAARQYSGLSDPALSELGEEQAKLAAARLGRIGGIDAVVASPLERAQQTAWAAADELGLSVETIDGLIEMSFGDWDGLTFSQAHDADPELHTAWLTDTSVTPPNGESLQHAFRRVRGTLDELRTRYEGKTVLVVSHVTPIKAILRVALDAPVGVYHRLHLDLASLSIAEFYSDGPTCVRLINDTSHLDALD